MYYDIEVRLTQGWFAVHYDMSQNSAKHMAEYYCGLGLDVRLVPHIVAL